MDLPDQPPPNAPAPPPSEAARRSRKWYRIIWGIGAIEYGSYPNAFTIPLVIEATGTTLPLGTTSSNDYLRQLIATGADERWFRSGSKKFRHSDGRVDGAEALKKGECGFAYIVGLDETDGSSAPLVIAPVIPGKKKLDAKEFKGAVVVLRMDGSVTSIKLRKDGTFVIDGTLVDPAHPEWKGKPFTIAWPE